MKKYKRKSKRGSSSAGHLIMPYWFALAYGLTTGSTIATAIWRDCYLMLIRHQVSQLPWLRFVSFAARFAFHLTFIVVVGLILADLSRILQDYAKHSGYTSRQSRRASLLAKTVMTVGIVAVLVLEMIFLPGHLSILILKINMVITLVVLIAIGYMATSRITREVAE